MAFESGVGAASASGGPTAVVLRAQGTNCDAEMCRAFALAGATPHLVHIEEAAGDAAVLDGAELIGFPGGFSYGDDIASGRVFAARLRATLWPSIRAAAERGVPMIGACNGFQVMATLGLLPGPADGEAWPREAPPSAIALAPNAGGRFIDRWVGVSAQGARPCVWTAPLVGREDVSLPIAHAEGRFVALDDATLDAVEAHGRVALRYRDNPNGSAGDVAGVCDASGRILGLMPHPERFLEWTRHPAWTRRRPGEPAGDPPGLAMFRSAVAAAGAPVA